MKILTIAWHTAELERICGEQLARIERQDEFSDSGLSRWAADSTIDFHHKAIEMLKRGIELTGEEKPFDLVDFLIDLQANKPVDARLINTRNGWCWIVSDELESNFGRKFLPEGSKSRIHKQLGLKQEAREVEVERFTKSYNGGSFQVRYQTFAKAA